MIQLLLAALPLCLPAVQDGAAVELRYDVAPGSVLRRDLLVKHEIQLDGVTFTRAGESPVRQDMPGWTSTFVKVTVDDTIGEVSGGLPRKLRRTWVDLGAQGTLQLAAAPGRPKFEDRAVLSSPLRERRVDFTWIEDESAWARLWVRDDAEEFWLAEMRGDMDALGLLPAAAVAPGDEWELSMETVRSLLAPGGNHLITPRTTNLFGRTMEVGIGGDLSEVLGPDLAGSARATFEGLREVDGERVAVLRLSVEGLRSINDRTDLWRLSAPAEERNEVAHLVSTLIEYGLDARGEALWSLERGHLHSLTLAGEEVFMLAVTKFGGPVTQPHETVQQSSFHGTLELTYRVAPPPPAPEPGAKGAARGH
jgi:hypothetical protein